jgi:hypothetical protein
MPPSKTTTGAGDLEARVTTLEAQMQEVLAKPAFKKRTERGVCALGFEPSAECPSATLGRFQGGCHGFGCLQKQQMYYKEYRARKKAEEAQNGSAPAKPKRTVAKKKEVGTPAKSVKRAVKKTTTTEQPKQSIKRVVKRRAV